MPAFSKISIKHLNECHSDLQTLFETVIINFDCSVICGHRQKDEQDKAFAEGKSKLKFPQSKHNRTPSFAVDVVPYPLDWNDANRMRFFGGYVMGVAQLLFEMGAMSHRVRWGGDWDGNTQLKDNNFNDFPHFELI